MAADAALIRRVRQREQPSGAVTGRLRQVQPQRFDQQRLREVLGDQRAAGLRLAQFAHQPLDRPAQSGLVGFGADVNDRRQHAEKPLRMHALEAEIAAHPGDVAAAVEHRRLAGGNRGEETEGVGRRGVGRAVKPIALAARQQHEIAGGEPHRLAPVQGEPARARLEGVASTPSSTPNASAQSPPASRPRKP